MVAAHDPSVLSKQSMPLTNKVVKVLSSHGSRYKTFGANIILLLNREGMVQTISSMDLALIRYR